jgi:hypothetical protein
VHLSPVGNIHAGRQAAGNGDPTDRPRFRLALPGSATRLGSQAAFDQHSQRLAQLCRSLLRSDEQVIRQINGGLHTGKHIPAFAGNHTIGLRRGFCS